jgi:PA14 domain
VPPVPLSPGLKAEFFDFTTPLKQMPDLTGRIADVTRTDAAINYRASTRPWAGLDARFTDTFAVRETGLLAVTTPGRYQLSLLVKDGGMLWIDGVLVINNSRVHPVGQLSRRVNLTAGLHTLMVESFANTGAAGLVLSWSGPKIRTQVIPANRFFH